MTVSATSEKQADCYALENFDPHQGQKLYRSLTECPHPQTIEGPPSSPVPEETELKQRILSWS